MDLEVKIGREVTGDYVVMVPSTCKKVSRRHATLHLHDDAFVLEDNESSNGTFVNGKRIARTKVNENDTIWLGGNDGSEECFQLAIKNVLETIRKEQEKLRTDYSEEFLKMKQAYIDYQNAVKNLKQEAAKKSQMPKFIPSIVIAVISLLVTIFAPGEYRIYVISAGSVVTTLVGILTMGKSGAINDQVNEEITELQIKYQKLYKCPKCGKKIPLTTHWKKLEADGKCPHGCGAEFVKHE